MYDTNKFVIFLQLTPDNSNLEGKSKKVRVLSGDGISADTTYHMTQFDTFCVLKHQETKESYTKDTVDTSKLQCCSIFRKLVENRFGAI